MTTQQAVLREFRAKQHAGKQGTALLESGGMFSLAQDSRRADSVENEDCFRNKVSSSRKQSAQVCWRPAYPEEPATGSEVQGYDEEDSESQGCPAH